jgi:hypothetical protein
MGVLGRSGTWEDVPIWDNDVKTLAEDFSAQIVDGVTIGTVLIVGTKGASGGRKHRPERTKL